ncbi:hypothetical protein CDG81_19285 [Actinopolyspora erythraea]|uniref:LPXTG cell wall anchor domain-containing protein n=1 Tax=Actinopolyspora erythraea TaxID=414996 RepID=A0A099DA20_9ACTN|nr:hypothetical protein [Actinopolyspora erythraea]ASU80047.1 hypothetical protein CDG81_19285 [Actinopolyspora erythraea]KGI82220.1 hypothetical protein IL38_05615 [Actinopolyspora erythraea]
MSTRTRTTWLVTGVGVVGVALLAALLVVPRLIGSDAEQGRTIAHRTQPQRTESHVVQPSRHTDEYWTEKRMREAEPAGPVAISPVPYGELAASAGILLVAGGTIVWLLRRQRRG